jgi:hypothetical protein
MGRGALWGQIDSISQFFLLTCLLCFVTVTLSHSAKLSMRAVVYWTFGIFALVAFVLTKQLAIFSLPVVLAFILLACRSLWTSATKFQGVVAISSVLFGIALFGFLDTRLEVPSTFWHSGYLFVWLGGGSSQGNMISRNGFNIWTFFEKDIWPTARQSIYCQQVVGHEFCLTPIRSGIALYISYILVLSVLYITAFLRPILIRGCRDERQTRFIIATLMLYLAQANLGFNMLLTGTHERYLYHCFPFLILAGVYFQEFSGLLSWRAVLFFAGVATIYGGFVLSVLHWPYQLHPLTRLHEFVAVVNFILLIYLLILTFRLAKHVSSP